MQKSTFLRSLGIFLILLGVFLATLLNVTLVIASVEGFYSFSNELIMRPARLSGVNCPLVIGKGQSTDVTIRVKNPTDRLMTTSLITRIVNHASGDIERRTLVKVEPGQEQVIVETLSPKHVIYDRMILADFFLIGTLGKPNALKICAITILPWDINAQMVFYLLVGLVVLIVGIGFYLWLRCQNTTKAQRPLTKPGVIALGVVAMAGLAGTVLGEWMMTLVAISITLLLFIILGAYVMHDA